MRICLLIASILLICCAHVSAQDTAKVVDRVYTTDDKVYVGQIIEDYKGDSLVIAVYKSGTYTISYPLIKRIQYRADNPNYTEPQSHKARKPIVRKENTDTAMLDLVAFNGYRANGHVTDKLVKKRNLGIALTVAGASLTTLGAVIYAVTPKQSISNSGGYQVATPSAGAISGILMIVGGIGITIPGVALWGSYSHRIHKAEKQD